MEQDDLDNDFGDFNDTTNDAGDDDFGDFSAPVEKEITEQSPPQEQLLTFEFTPGNDREESRLLQVETNLPQDLNDLFKKCWPIKVEIEDPPEPIVPLLEQTGSRELIKLNPKFATGKWHETFLKCQHDTIYTEESFRWRKSLIRTAYLESITAVAAEKKRASTVNAEKPVVQIQKVEEENFTHPTNESNNSTTDSREQELIAAKKLCDIPEEDIRKKSKQEIRELIAQLTASLSKIQEQANYWLDAKEQLVMESEMHNKMIASLVTYAQQKEKTSKKK